MIITFYSYKGGVGRSMAVANIATILAHDYGRRVIVVDWDLEAPGLHKFFKIPDTEVGSGVIDFLYEYKELVARDKPITIDTLPKVERFITPIRTYPKGDLWLMPAGKQDAGYADRVNAFDWANFYEKLNGSLCIEYMKKELSDFADYIIVDSRTGITDIGGICTLQLPDAVVLLFASNWQNVDGVEQIILNLRENPVIKEMNKTITIIPVPARIEFYHPRREKWKKEFIKRFSEYLPDYIDKKKKFFDDVEILYFPQHSGEEEIAVDKPEEDGSGRTSISYSYYRLAEYITTISIEYYKKELKVEKRSKIETAQTYRKIGSLEQILGDNDRALEDYLQALKFFERQEGYKQVTVHIISNIAKIYQDKVGLMDTMTLDRYAQAFTIYEELNDKNGALQTFNDISPDTDDTVEDFEKPPKTAKNIPKVYREWNGKGDKSKYSVDNLSDCIKIKPYLRDDAAYILSVVSKFNLHPNLVLPTLNHLADSVVPAVQDKALDILEKVVKVKPEDAVPILKRLIEFSWITSIRDRAKSILDETSSQ